jgi:hypothetical protein
MGDGRASGVYRERGPRSGPSGKPWGDFTDEGTPGAGHVPLLLTSPAIDAGNDAVCLATDQLGQPRVGRCDIGAIEFQPAVPPPRVGVHTTFVQKLALTYYTHN